MIRVKLTEMGGYVLGDGDCPFNPDDFLKLFIWKVMEGKRQGLTEIGITDEEINQALNEQYDTIDRAAVLEYADDVLPETLLEVQR